MVLRARFPPISSGAELKSFEGSRKAFRLGAPSDEAVDTANELDEAEDEEEAVAAP
jgi:hypothetical protein